MFLSAISALVIMSCYIPLGNENKNYENPLPSPIVVDFQFLSTSVSTSNYHEQGFVSANIIIRSLSGVYPEAVYAQIGNDRYQMHLDVDLSFIESGSESIAVGLDFKVYIFDLLPSEYEIDFTIEHQGQIYTGINQKTFELLPKEPNPFSSGSIYLREEKISSNGYCFFFEVNRRIYRVNPQVLININGTQYPMRYNENYAVFEYTHFFPLGSEGRSEVNASLISGEYSINTYSIYINLPPPSILDIEIYFFPNSQGNSLIYDLLILNEGNALLNDQIFLEIDGVNRSLDVENKNFQEDLSFIHSSGSMFYNYLSRISEYYGEMQLYGPYTVDFSDINDTASMRIWHNLKEFGWIQVNPSYFSYFSHLFGYNQYKYCEGVYETPITIIEKKITQLPDTQEVQIDIEGELSIEGPNWEDLSISLILDHPTLQSTGGTIDRSEMIFDPETNSFSFATTLYMHNNYPDLEIKGDIFGTIGISVESIIEEDKIAKYLGEEHFNIDFPDTREGKYGIGQKKDLYLERTVGIKQTHRSLDYSEIHRYEIENLGRDFGCDLFSSKKYIWNPSEKCWVNLSYYDPLFGAPVVDKLYVNPDIPNTFHQEFIFIPKKMATEIANEINDNIGTAVFTHTETSIEYRVDTEKYARYITYEFSSTGILKGFTNYERIGNETYSEELKMISKSTFWYNFKEVIGIILISSLGGIALLGIGGYLLETKLGVFSGLSRRRYQKQMEKEHLNVIYDETIDHEALDWII